jgi:outer membrane protein OmpA-like peptidoglycan-associated protein
VFRIAVVAALLLVAPAGTAAAQLPGLRKVKEAASKATRAADDVRKKVDTVAGTARSVGNAAAKLDPRVWDDFHFVPGSKVLFYTDFSEDRSGSFAGRLHYRRGSMSVVERDGRRMLRATAKSEFLIPTGSPLPERFTLEMDVVAPTGYCCLDGVVFFEGGTEVDQGRYSAEVSWAPHGAWVNGSGMIRANSLAAIPEEAQPRLRGTVVHLRVVMDGPSFAMYANERRLLNIPELEFKRDTAVRVVLHGSADPGMAAWIAGIRVAERVDEVLADALAARGRWSTLGILFALANAELGDESAPVLREIAATLKKQPDLRIRIEAHTDNAGDAAANLTLSQKRADAVRAALISRFGIAPDRIVAQGLGDTQPVAPNDTPEGRAQNRRVEVVRQ